MDQQTNLVEYNDPALYDSENTKFEPDGPFYLTLAQRIGGPVLELGCGTGRLTIPLAGTGIDMTGLDVVPAMVEHARGKSQGLSVRWVEADARAFQLDRQFRLIFESGAMFQHLIERPDHEAVLARVREHLLPDGRFVVAVLFPTAELMLNQEKTEYDWFSYTDAGGREVRVSGYQQYDRLGQFRTETAFRRWNDADGQDVTRVAPLQMRLFFPRELETLLHYNGFVVDKQYGDLDFSPLTADSPHIIYVCRKAG
jgi:SAM-dependent methyltransferase